MALPILENNRAFYIYGNINCDNVISIKNYIEHLLEKRSHVTININKVTGIDSRGVLTLTKIYQNALEAKKIFTIIGFGSKDLYDHFNSQKIV
jgi:ABC-type transporter Mla MlaB component|tara:strand:- start:216 stop:494 length:279 start_codon:yes stop_codon:yes gene_type:complete